MLVLNVIAQSEKKPMTNADVISMLEAGLSESTIVLAIQQSQPNFDTSSQSLIQLKNKGASPKILDFILQTQLNKSSAVSESLNNDNSKQSSVIKVSIYDFNFDLIRCVTSGGDSIICVLTITNKDKSDRELHIYNDSRMIDEFGGEYLVAGRTLGKETYKNEFLFAKMTTMIPDVKVAATLKFEKVKSNLKFVKALRIHCIGGEKKFDVDFFNIPVKDAVASNNSQVPINGSSDLTLGMSLYNSQNVEKSFDPLAKAISNGESVTIPIYHYVRGPVLDFDDDVYEGFFKITKDTLTFRNAGNVTTKSGMKIPYSNFSIPINKIISVSVETRKEGRLIMDLMIADEKGKEKKKTYSFYPTIANLLKVPLNTSEPMWRISCPDCDQKSEVITKLLRKFMAEAGVVK